MRKKLHFIFLFLSGCLTLVFSLSPLLASRDDGAIHSGRKYTRSLFREIRAGILVHDVDHLWSNMHVEKGIDVNLEILFFRPSMSLLYGSIFPNLGITINDRGNTSKIYAGFLWEWTTRHGFFLDLGLGAAIHDGELNTPVPGRKLLGTRALFRIPVEIGFRISGRLRLSVMFSHVSNGYTAEYNQGLDVLGLRCGYCF
jgi:lipid A 3-O-deacylase